MFHRRIRRFTRRSLLVLMFWSAQQASAQGPSSPSAQETPLDLTWISAEPGCDGSGVADEALRLVAPGVSPRPLSARAELQRSGSGWVVQLETRSAEHVGKRMLRGETCKEIERAMALVIAMTLETEADSEPAAGRAGPAAASAPRPEPAPVAPFPAIVPDTFSDTSVDPPRERRAAMPAGLALRADGSLALGLKPGMSGGFGGGLGAYWGPWEALLGTTFWPSTRSSILDRRGYVEVTRLNFWFSACVQAWRRGPFGLAPCLEPEVTLFRFRAVDILEAKEGPSDPLFSLTASADLRYWPFGRWIFFSLAPGITWEKRQPFELSLNGAAASPNPPIKVYETFGVGPRLRIGVGARF
jgi:hypothetical protein